MDTLTADRPNVRGALPGALVLLGLTLPVAAVSALADADGANHGGWVCPLLDSTGVPCPGCGATRAMFHFANGDSGFLNYNWFWPLAWTALVAWAFVLIRRGITGRPRLGRYVHALNRFLDRGGAPLVVLFAIMVMVPPWLVALSNLEHIG